MTCEHSWLQSLPVNWHLLPLKAVCGYRVSNVDKVPTDDELPVRLCNYSDVYNNEFITLNLSLMETTATQAEIERFHLDIDDVVITKDSEAWNDIGVPAVIAQTAPDLVCGYHLAMLRARPDRLNGRYLFRCLQARPIQFQFERSASGVTRYGLGLDAIGRLYLPVPPLPQQCAIADHLDRETARIDALIGAKERALTLLAEKRKALITRAVTRGLDPAVPLRDSGIPWLGQIPAHWEVRRLKYMASVNDETLGEDTDGDYEMQYIDIGSVDSLGNIGEPATFSFDHAPSRARRRVRDGDMIISCVRTYLQAIAPIQHPPANLIVSTGFAVVRPRAAHYAAAFSKFSLRDPRFIAEVEKRSVGVSYPAINPSDLADIGVTVPPLNEQWAIANHISLETAKLEALRTITERSITLLKERRAALIAATVTGQIAIPEVAA